MRIDDPDPMVRLLLRGLRPPALLLAGLLFLRLLRVLIARRLVGRCVGAPVGISVRDSASSAPRACVRAGG